MNSVFYRFCFQLTLQPEETAMVVYHFWGLWLDNYSHKLVYSDCMETFEIQLLAY